MTRSGQVASGAIVDPNASALFKSNPPIAVGTAVPDFSLATVDGKHYGLSDLKGHPSMVEFFAVWCPHCQREAPILNRLDKDFVSRGFKTLSVLASPYDRNREVSGGTTPVSAADVRWFQSTFNVAHPILIDPEFSTTSQYGVQGYPTIYILNSDGTVSFHGSGDIPYNTLADALRKAS